MTSVSRRTRLLAAPASLALAVGALGVLTAPAHAATSTFSQDTAIFVGDSSFNQTSSGGISIPNSGAATPYPSQITVTHQATIIDLDVTLNDLTHVAVRDVDVLLVGPGGQQVVLMSDHGNNGVTDHDFTLDDEAAASLPDTGSAVAGGTYKPSNNGAGDAWPAPAPASTDNLSLSVFDGTIAAGVWSLYVVDDLGGFDGDIASWSLNFELATAPYPSTLQVSGLPAATDVNVKLNGVTSDHMDDLNLLLVGPGGQQSILISDSGGSTDVSGINLTVDDEAAAPFPDSTEITSGSYQPVDRGPGNVYAPPAPPLTNNTALSVFDGLSPNGEWRLFADDDAGGLITVINGWALEFTWTDTQNPTGTVQVNSGAAKTGTKTVTLKLTAFDPAPASGVTHMRFSNNGVTFGAYQPFAPTASWTLAGGEGKKTVYAQFRDSDGNESAVVSDAITYGVGPKAKSVSPKKNAKGVSRSVTVTIKANEKLNKNTVNGKKVFLKKQGSSAKVPATVTYVKKTKTIVLNPNGNLAPGAKYTVTVKGVKDAKGNTWDETPKRSGAQPLKYSFTT